MREPIISDLAQRDIPAIMTRFPDENLEKRQIESTGADTFEVTTRTETDIVWVDPSNNVYVTVPGIFIGRIKLR